MPNIIRKMMNIDQHNGAYSNNVINTSPNTNYNLTGLRAKYESNNILNSHQNQIENKQAEILPGQLVNKLKLAKK